MPYAALHPDAHSLTNPSVADLAALASKRERPGLVVFDYRFDSFEPFAGWTGLESLKVQGASKLRRLDGLHHLSPTLRELVLATPTGSDGSGRIIGVESFAPLETLRQLERLILMSVRSSDRDLSSITRLTWLRELDLSGIPELGVEDFARLSLALPNTVGRCLKPYVTIPGVGRCSKCGGPSVLLNGAAPRARKWVCPKCNPKLLSAHVARWQAVTKTPWVAG